jgi:hypothetical protein
VAGQIGTGALEFGVGHVRTGDPCCTSGCYSQFTPELDDDILIPPLQLNTNAVTFTCWAKSSGPQWPDAALFGSDGAHGEFTGDTVVVWDVGTHGAAGVGYNWNNESGTWNFDPATFELPPNKWAFNALVIAPTYADMYMRTDGDPSWLTATNNYGHDPEPFDIPGHIGSHKWRYFAGVIDDFRIYDRSLDPCEVAFLAGYAHGTDPTSANLFSHYEFDDGSGLVAADSGGGGVNYWPVPSVANIAGDDVEAQYHRFVNMLDFNRLADDWLIDMPWPRP